jgi:N-acetylmuramoyl-L-alanine amidase
MIICIDPGHGGRDPGTVNLAEGLLEKDIALNVSLRLAEYLRRKGAKVVLTRTGDTDLAPGSDDDAELKARGVVSNINKADIFISVHVDSFSDPEANGSTVHYWPGSVKGKALAESVSRSLGIASGLASRGIKESRFGVLGYADAPAILVELGFMTNKADRWSLREPSVQDKCALGISFGLL